MRPGQTVQLTCPMRFYDQTFRPKGAVCVVMGPIRSSSESMPLLWAVRFEDGQVEYVYERDVEEGT